MRKQDKQIVYRKEFDDAGWLGKPESCQWNVSKCWEYQGGFKGEGLVGQTTELQLLMCTFMKIRCTKELLFGCNFVE